MGKVSIQEIGVKAKRNQETHDKAQLRGEAVLEDIANIKIASPFMDLFPVRREILEAIINDMQLNGYDHSKPLDIWAEQGVVLDGHTRLVAAKQTGIRTVPIHRHRFKDRDTALGYALHNQRDRRNWTAAEKLRAIKLVDSLKTRGRKKKAPGGANSRGKSAAETARRTGLSVREVERGRTVLKNPKYTKKIRTGEIETLGQADREIRTEKRETALPSRKTVAPGAKYIHLLDKLLNQLPEHRPAELSDQAIRVLGKQAHAIHSRVREWLK